MSYIYYPGCSAKSTGKAFEESLLAVFAAFHMPIEELKDWNCCGATAYMSISELKAFALCARNFALAEQQCKGKEMIDIVTHCAACYLGLNKAYRYLNEYPELRSKVDESLQAAGLKYTGRIRIRHCLDVLANDIGIEKIKSKVKNPLDGLRVASYYGCQLVRPYADFDDQHNPTTMDRIMESLGAEVIDWPIKTRCCGGSLTGTIQDYGLQLSYNLLKEAKKCGCNVISTACSLCQFNLECFQPQMRRRFDDTINMSVAFFTQLMGVAFGMPSRKLGLQRLLVPLQQPFKTKQTVGGGYVQS
jgi:heterodisulfide reductase subunit B